MKPLLKEAKITSTIQHKQALVGKAEFCGKMVVFCQTGVGMSHAHEGVEALIREMPPSLILSIGYAGGALPALHTGDLVIPTEIRSETPTDHFKVPPEWRGKLLKIAQEEKLNYQEGILRTLWKLATREQKRMWGEKGTSALDQETMALAAVAIKKRVPFISLRVIFDSLNEELPFTESVTNEAQALSQLIKNPKAVLKIPKFMKMNKVCQENLARVVRRFVQEYRHIVT